MFAFVAGVSRLGYHYMLGCGGVVQEGSIMAHGPPLGVCTDRLTHASEHIACMFVAVCSWGSESYVHNMSESSYLPEV